MRVRSSFAALGLALSVLAAPARGGQAPDPRADWESLIEEARLSTQRAAREILERRRDGVRVRAVLANKDTKTITEYHGVPSRVKLLETEGRVFRHWIKSEEAFEEIARSRLLRQGPVSYVEFTGSSRAYIKDIYLDLVGVFFTTPGTPASEPRVMNTPLERFVDFKVPRGIQALDLDLGMVLMLPGARSAPAVIPIEIVGAGAPRPLVVRP